MRSIPPVDREVLTRLINAGQTHRQICAQLDISRNTIRRRINLWGLDRPRRGAQGSAHANWKNGRRLGKWATIEIWAPFHPRAKRGGRSVAEHHLIAELVLGRYLTPMEVVHHRDNHPHHNWPSNLAVFASNADHLRHELTARVKATPRPSIPGAYRSPQTLDQCPSAAETLTGCPSEILTRLAWFVDSHRPMPVHRMLPPEAFLRAGAWRDPWSPPSTASDTTAPPPNQSPDSHPA
jgi:hypothetical protein